VTNHNTYIMYNAFTATICEWPKGFQTFLSVVTSTGFTILVILMLRWEVI